MCVCVCCYRPQELRGIHWWPSTVRSAFAFIVVFVSNEKKNKKTFFQHKCPSLMCIIINKLLLQAERWDP